MSEEFSVLKISTPTQEGVMQASKWLHSQVLLDEKEMEDLFQALQPFAIHIVSTLVGTPHGQVSFDEFLQAYAVYVQALKKGCEPDEKTSRPLFSSVFTRSSDALYAMEAGGKYLIKPLLPVVQLQLHHVYYSTIDGKFYPKVHGKDSIAWGLQFSYPQLFQDPSTRAFCKVDQSSRFPNTALYNDLTKWVRAYTLPTPFLVDGQRKNQPIRLGKKCWEWIAEHPHLASKGLSIMELPCPLKS